MFLIVFPLFSFLFILECFRCFAKVIRKIYLLIHIYIFHSFLFISVVTFNMKELSGQKNPYKYDRVLKMIINRQCGIIHFNKL